MERRVVSGPALNTRPGCAVRSASHFIACVLVIDRQPPALVSAGGRHPETQLHTELVLEHSAVASITFREPTFVSSHACPTRSGGGPVSAAQAVVSWSHSGWCRNEATFAALAGEAAAAGSAAPLRPLR